LRRVVEGEIIEDFVGSRKGRTRSRVRLRKRTFVVQVCGAVESTRCIACVTAQGNSATGRTNDKGVVAETPVPTVFFIDLSAFALASEIAGGRRVSK
jgi:hypothetical protein